MQVFAILFAQEPTQTADTLYVINSISKNPISNFTITTTLDLQFSTDTNGYIILPKLPSTHYPILLMKDNHHSITLKKTDLKNIIELKPIIFLADEVRISESPFKSKLNLPIKTYHINSTQIESASSTQALIESLPSITLKSYGGRAGVSTVSVHGGQSQRFSVMFDGVPINNEQNGGADISQIPTFLLSNLEYLSQGHSSRFGASAMTGVLNLSPSKEGSKVSISAGNFNEWSIGSLFSKSHQRSKLTFAIGRSNYDAKYSYKELGNYNSAFSDLGKVYYGLSNSIQQDYVYSHFQHPIKNSNLSIAYFDVCNSRNLSTNVYSSPINIQKMWDGLQVFSSSLKLANSQFSHSRKQTTIEYLNDKHTLITNNLSFSLLYGDVTSTINAINVFSESSRLLDMSKTYYTGSLNYDNTWNYIKFSTSLKIEIEGESENVLSYDFIINNSQSQQFSSSFTFSHNYKKPNFNDLFWEPFGDPQLNTEFSSNYYLKNNIISNMGELNIDAHYIHFINLISWKPVIGSIGYWKPENISRANSYGADISIKSNLIQNTSITASYSISITENYNLSLGHHHGGKSLLYTPIHSGSSGINKSFKQSTFTISTKFIGNRIASYNWPQDNILPAYFLTNMSYKHQISPLTKFDLYIHLNSSNIFDTQYQSVYGFPVPGRSYSITMTIKETN